MGGRRAGDVVVNVHPKTPGKAKEKHRKGDGKQPPEYHLGDEPGLKEPKREIVSRNDDQKGSRHIDVNGPDEIAWFPLMHKSAARAFRVHFKKFRKQRPLLAGRAKEAKAVMEGAGDGTHGLGLRPRDKSHRGADRPERRWPRRTPRSERSSGRSDGGARNPPSRRGPA